MDWMATLAALALTLGLIVFANARATRPADPLRPRLIPWRVIIIAAGLLAILLVVHLARLAGIKAQPMVL